MVDYVHSFDERVIDPLEHLAMTAAIFPSAAGDRSISYEVRFGAPGSDRAVYLRRRLIVAIIFAALVAVIGLSAHSVLADHGGVPASTPVVPPAALSASAGAPVATAAAPATPVVGAIAVGTPYLVQPGDTIWGIAEIWHGSVGLADYVEQLVDLNGGAALQAGQLLTLP